MQRRRKHQQAAELFCLDEHEKRSDASIHNAILNSGDHKAALAVSRRESRELGFSQESTERLLPNTASRIERK
jgi:hypothetical protein